MRADGMALWFACLFLPVSAFSDVWAAEQMRGTETRHDGAHVSALGGNSPGASELYRSTYAPARTQTIAFVNAIILDGAGGRFEDATLLVRDGRIGAIGNHVDLPPDAEVIDAGGKWVTPGIIDIHSHLGAYAVPLVKALSDGNEATDPNTADVRVEHSIWPQDPAFSRARAGGVTTLQVLPGSTNLFGGRSVVLKNVPSVSVQGMKFPGAAQGLKMACGENPKIIYGANGRAPMSRMGSFAAYRTAWARAAEYRKRWDEYEEKHKTAANLAAPTRDLKMETLAATLRGELRVHIHCYRADEMVQMLDLAREFGYTITAFHHAVEAYKIADLLQDSGVCTATWAESWGYKMEMYDSVRANAAILHARGACTIIHSDSVVDIQQLNQEAARAMYAGTKAGLEISKADAWTWISRNPARALGIEEETGSLVPGKAADVVLWSGDPFSVYSLAELVLVDGVKTFDRDSGKIDQRSDFELGHPGAGRHL